MNICIISGSARENNSTVRVAYAVERILKPNHQTTLIDFRHYDIPFINQSEISKDNLSAWQQQLIDAMTQANLVILISPEYNWSTTPEILNFLHRFGDREFSGLFNEKIFALVGTSSGKGGKTPALHLSSVLSKIISFLNAESVVSPKIFESHFIREVLDEEGNSLGNNFYDKGLNDFIEYNVRLAERWKRA